MFNEWLENELKERDWKPADLAHAARISRGTITNILTGMRKAGPEVCRAIARGLRITEEEVFRQAGLLSPKIVHSDPYFEALNCLWLTAPEWKKRDVVVTLRASIRDHQRREEERERQRRLGEPVDGHEVY